jgi:acyl-CoA oxidase
VDGKRKALGTFIIQIRCMKSHLALEGIEVGDIGPKYGYNTKDNGYLRFNNFRIPKENLLGKYM